MASLSRRAVEPLAAPASDPVPSSSPAFATPPVNPARPLRTAPVPAPPALKPTVLPIILPPATLRPLAFRTFTKKHNLTLTSPALAALATFIGRHCGSGWREEGLAERVLEEVARAWKKGGGQVIVDGDGPLLKGILKTLEGCMSGGRVVQVKNPSLSRDTSFKFGDVDAINGRPALLEKQESFGMSNLNVADDEEDDGSKDPRDWIKVIGGFEQPKMVFNITKKHFDSTVTDPSGGVVGPAFGWTDFLGTGSERATGSRMPDINLDNPQSFTALRTLLSTYSALPVPEFPLAIVLMGNFVSSATMAGVPNQGSIEYKEHFNALASVLADFPQLIARTTLVFVPGDNDAWPSAFSAGAAVPLPRKGVPELFTSRIRRVIQEANREVGGAGKRKEGEAIWTTNPSRLTWFGVQGEMVLFKDDVTGRLRRTAIRFKKPGTDEDDEDMDLGDEVAHQHDNSREATVASVMEQPDGGAAETSMDVDQQPQPKPQQEQLDPDTLTARALTRTLLDQSHLSPFPLHFTPIIVDLPENEGPELSVNGNRVSRP
ncbi:DNA polymerase alpha/epsilon subunit B [Neofusicoccum parvum]|uniref:DNA polymerase alpha/epsilon subunit B n=1 Tax=Neofusicoccum parvum TaxID=310453 RepID=A0ACB5S895_9PEZI|nr:DNA polymerase alpha/epsilon subunit B [Neofusicoccum parvum]